MHGLRRTVVAFLTLLAAPVIAGAQAAPDTLIIAAGGDFSIPLPGMSRPVEAQRISELEPAGTRMRGRLIVLWPIRMGLRWRPA